MFLIPSHASRDRAHVTKADNEAREEMVVGHSMLSGLIMTLINDDLQGQMVRIMSLICLTVKSPFISRKWYKIGP